MHSIFFCDWVWISFYRAHYFNSSMSRARHIEADGPKLDDWLECMTMVSEEAVGLVSEVASGDRICILPHHITFSTTE